MKKIKINLKQVASKDTDLMVSSLKRGEVIVYPTDTIYGLGCVATNKSAINKIRKIKKREKKKPLLILVSGLAMLKKYCFVSGEQEEYLRKSWEQPHPRLSLVRRGALKPLTVILKSKGVLPKELTGDSENIAVRLPKNELLLKIIKGVKKPIVSTSLNIGGEKNLNSLENLEKHFKSPRTPFTQRGQLFDLIVDAGEIKSKPSKIIDITDIKKIKVIRK